MDKTSKSCNNDNGVPEETAMEKVLSDLQALKKLYGLLQRLDETSRALLKKLLDDATRQALLKQANALTTASDSVTPFSLDLASPKKMDQATLSSSSFLNKESEMEQILSDLQALTRLYMLLHKGPADENLDEASKALLMKILEDATQEAVRRQAKMLSSSQVSPALERKTFTRSDCRTRHADPSLRPVASPRPSLLASERSRQINRQHSTVSRRSGLHVHRHAAEEPPLARLASKCSSRIALPARNRPSQEQHRHAVEEPPLARLASKCSSRSALPARHLPSQEQHRHALEEPPLARLASKRSSRTALPARHRPSQEQQHSSLSLHRSLMAGTSQHGTVTGGTRLANRRDSIRRSSGRGDQWSLERSSSCSSRRSVSRELSPRQSLRLRGRTTPRHVGTESSSSVSSFERQSSRLSVGMTSRHGVKHVGRGVATPECSSSSNTMATIQSRIRPSNSLHVERSLRRSAEERRRTSRESHVSDVSSADMYSSSVSRSSGSRSSSVAPTLSASTSPTTSPSPRAFANPYCYSPPVKASPKPRAFANPYGYSPPVTASPKPRAFATPYGYSPPVTAPRGIVPPVYAPKMSRSMRRRHRQEILEKRLARLRMLKDKIATVFHHRHDHHHHHHLGGGQQEAGPSSRSVVRGAGNHLNSPWQYLTSMFHRAKGKVKNTRSRTVAGVPEKRRGGGGGGGDMHALFDAVRRHLKGKRRAPAGLKLRRKASRVQAKKMHWWQQLSRRRGVPGLTAGSKPRRRLGHGKAGWL